MSVIRHFLSSLGIVNKSDGDSCRRKECAVAGYLIPEKMSICADDEIVLVDEAIIINLIEIHLSKSESVYINKGYELMDFLRVNKWETPESTCVKRYRMSIKKAKYFFKGIKAMPIQSLLLAT